MLIRPRRPNYGLRRIVALAVVVAFAFAGWRIASGVGSLFRSHAKSDSSTGSSPRQPSPSATVVEPPKCTTDSELTSHRGYAQWDQTLLDTRLHLPAAYAPPDLVPVTRAGFPGADGRFEVRAILVQDLSALRKAAATAGNPIEIEASYRSFDAQRSLYDRRKGAPGQGDALATTARPGHSEHQLGTAIDFKSKGAVDVSAAWSSTPTGQWMEQNGYRYGFVESYPAGAEAFTCYPYEPWHYRYFGRALAKKIHDTGLTTREYLWNEQHGGPAF